MRMEGPADLPEQGACLWWHEGTGIVGQGRAVAIDVAMEPDRGQRAWGSLRTILEERRAMGMTDVAMGSLTFDPETRGSVLFVPETASRHSGGLTTIEETAGMANLDRLRYARGQMDELHWLDEVAAAIEEIEKGTLLKVVLARDEVVWSKTSFSERTIAMRLVRSFPQCYTFVCDGFVGATPELLVRRQERNVESLVLAGSARRGSDPDDDAAEATRLLGSTKERAEHALAVDSVSDALKSVCIGISTEPEPQIMQLLNMQHLATKVTAELADPEVSVLELVDRLHPTAAVGGVPRDSALVRIKKAEGPLRGRYAGPVGWVDADGNGEWGIGLRCALLSGNRAQLFAGAGIVAGSLPEAELEETRLKFRAMESVLGLTS